MAKGEATGFYIPESITSKDPQEIVAWVTRELSKISQAMETVPARRVEFLNREPSKPREGFLYGADGTNWNPGNGKGLYVRVGAAWVPAFNVDEPLKAAFFAEPTNEYSGGGMPTGFLPFTAIYDRGSHYDGVSKYIIPENGAYLISLYGLIVPPAAIGLGVNGGVPTYNLVHWTNAPPSYISCGATLIIPLVAGDELQIYGWNGGGYHKSWTRWSITFLG